MAARNPARVLPEPVGAQTNVCRPATIAGQLPAWASVGPSANRRSNHVRTAGWKPSRASARPETAGADAGELTAQVHHTRPALEHGLQRWGAGRVRQHGVSRRL